MALAALKAPGSRAVVRTCQLAGIEWQVHLWIFDGPSGDPHEAVAHVRATDGEMLGYEAVA